MPRVGSSRISTCGSVKSHLLSTTFCWLPPESLPVSASTVGALMFMLWRYSSATLISSLPFTQPPRDTFDRFAAEMLVRMSSMRLRPYFLRSSVAYAMPCEMASDTVATRISLPCRKTLPVMWLP